MNPYISGVFAILGVIIGFALNFFKDKYYERRRSHAIRKLMHIRIAVFLDNISFKRQHFDLYTSDEYHNAFNQDEIVKQLLEIDRSEIMPSFLLMFPTEMLIVAFNKVELDYIYQLDKDITEIKSSFDNIDYLNNHNNKSEDIGLLVDSIFKKWDFIINKGNHIA